MYVTSFVRGEANKSVFLISKILGNHEDPLGSLLSLARPRRPAAPLFQTPPPTETQKVRGEGPMRRRRLSPRRRRAWPSA